MIRRIKKGKTKKGTYLLKERERGFSIYTRTGEFVCSTSTQKAAEAVIRSLELDMEQDIETGFVS